MTTLLMIRHGESEANRNKVFAGNLDADLQSNGLKQAQKTAEFIVANYKVDKVYASDLKRAFKTGKCVADLAGVEIIPNKNLREISAGQWEGMKYSDLATDYSDDYNIWLTDIGNACCTGGESVKQLAKRVMAELTAIASANDGKTIVIATHATPIRAMQTLVKHGNLENMHAVAWVTNASVTTFEYENGVWKCVKISEDAHLNELKTELPKNV